MFFTALKEGEKITITDGEVSIDVIVRIHKKSIRVGIDAPLEFTLDKYYADGRKKRRKGKKDAP